MLGFLRRNAGSTFIKLLLGGIALSFIIGFGAISYLNRTTRARGGMPDADVVATVGGQPISRDAFLRRMDQIKQNYSQNGLPTDSDLFNSPFFMRQVLQALVDQAILRLSAEELGLGVSDHEIADYIRDSGAFNEHGHFNKDRLLNYLHRANMTIEEFEDSIRRDLLGSKIGELLQASVVVTDDELWQQYQRENEKIDLRVVKVESKGMTVDPASLTDEDLKAAYDESPEDYREPERRRLTYFYTDLKSYTEDVQISEEDVKAKYDADISKYQSTEAVSLSRILVQVTADATDADKAAAKKRADQAHEKAVAPGAEFAKLAEEYSDDAITRSKGGDLGFREQSGSPKELVEVAFGLADGAVSEVIETPRGYEIVKRTGHRDAGTKPFDEVKGQIRFELQLEKARERMKADIDAAYAKLAPGTDIRTFADENEMEVGSTPLFSQAEGLQGMEKAQQIVQLAYGMSKDEISKPFEGYSRWYIFQLAEIAESRLPTFDEAKEKVREKLAAKRQAEMATVKAKEGLAALASGTQTLNAFAQSIGTTVIDSGEFAHSSRSVPNVGLLGNLTDAAFALPEAAKWPTEPVNYSEGAVVFEVVSRTPASKADFETKKDGIRQEVLSQKRMRFMSEWVDDYRAKYPVVENQAFWSRLATK